ncbi:hypothetical protein D5086_017507 [Populus alba]|uniref:Uncharacterized protein n=1 Tax=Populus alba TaxID=43335 RepID=A0ACC4BM94_POPAL
MTLSFPFMYPTSESLFLPVSLRSRNKNAGGGCSLSRLCLASLVYGLFVSSTLSQYITADVVDRNNGRIVATAARAEHSIKNTLECARSCNAKAATVVGEVLAMRNKVEEGLE